MPEIIQITHLICFGLSYLRQQRMPAAMSALLMWRRNNQVKKYFFKRLTNNLYSCFCYDRNKSFHQFTRDPHSTQSNVPSSSHTRSAKNFPKSGRATSHTLPFCLISTSPISIHLSPRKNLALPIVVLMSKGAGYRFFSNFIIPQFLL